MTAYQRNKVNVMLDKLQGELRSAGLPVDHLTGTTPAQGDFTVVTTRDLTAPEITTMDNTIAVHDGRLRQKRPLLEIYQDLGVLTGAQMTTIWNDLMSGTPHKLTQDEGPNAGSILVLDWVNNWTTTITVADRTEGKKRAITMYTQDNVNYLVHPPFDTSINIPGDEPVP